VTADARKPWEKALEREPLCAFVEAVVDGYSPIDKHLCAFARRAQWLRQLPWWSEVPDCSGPRGEARYCRESGYWPAVGDALCGEIPWRTLHVE
jgi:hypothetical protein